MARRPRKVTIEFQDCAIGYTRVSTAKQAESGAGLDAQHRAIEAHAAFAGYGELRWVEDGGVSGKVAPDRRPGLGAALDALDRGEACALIASKADRVSRSVRDLLALVDRADRNGWRLVVLDMNVDTATPVGRMTLTILGAVAEFERARIAERITEGLESKRLEGRRLGRKVRLPDEVRQRIAADHAAGRALAAIARDLTAEGVPTAQGGARWHASTVQAVLRSLQHDADQRDVLAGIEAQRRLAEPVSSWVEVPLIEVEP